MGFELLGQCSVLLNEMMMIGNCYIRGQYVAFLWHSHADVTVRY